MGFPSIPSMENKYISRLFIVSSSIFKIRYLKKSFKFLINSSFYCYFSSIRYSINVFITGFTFLKTHKRSYDLYAFSIFLINIFFII